MFTQNDSDLDLSTVDLDDVAAETGNDENFVFTQERFNNAWFYALKHFTTRDAEFAPEPSYEERYLYTFPASLRSRAQTILNEAITFADSQTDEIMKTPAFKNMLEEGINRAFNTEYHNTLCRPLQGEVPAPTTGILNLAVGKGIMFKGARVLDLSEVRYVVREYSDEQLKTLLRSIPAHIDTVDLSGCLDKPRDNNSLIRILAHLPPNVRSVTLSDNWQNNSILNYTAKTGGEIAHIAGHLPLTVKNIVYTFPKGLEHHQKEIITTRNTLVSQRRIQFPASYQGIYRAHGHQDELMQAKALLNDYAKGNNALFLFFTCHAGRSKTREVAALVRRINNPQAGNTITTMEQLLVELKRIDPENRNGSLARRTSFIEDQYAARHQPADELNHSIAAPSGGF